MAGSFDNVMRRLIGTYGDQFTQWLDPQAAFVQSLNIELKSQHIYADALLQVNKRKKPGILHLEVQTEKDPEMGVRLLEYNVLASRQYEHIPVSSYVIYLRDVKDVPVPPYIRRFPDEEGEEVHRFYYTSIELADIPAEVILQSGLIGLLPFVTLTRGGKESEVVKTMIDRLAERKAFDLLMMAQVLGGLVFEEESEREAFKRRFKMFQNVLQESWVYQEIGQEFLEKGREEERQKRVQGLRETIMSGLQVRFPEILALAMQQISGINEPEVLQTALSKLFAAQTVEEAQQILLDINKQ
jgi:predicted transposase YdaD